MPTAAKKGSDDSKRRLRAKARVAVATFKGGDGKTTLAVALASLASQQGQKTLLIDLEQRGHAAFGVLQDLPLDAKAHGTKQLLLDEPYMPLAANAAFDVLPGSSELDDARIRRLDNEALFDRIETLDYERIFLDCPANDQILLRLGVVAGDTLLVPIKANPWSINAAQDMLKWANERFKKGRPGPSRIAIVANNLDPRRVADAQLVEHLKGIFPDFPIFQVRVDIGLLNMVLERRPLLPSDLSDVTLTQLHALLQWIDKP